MTQEERAALVERLRDTARQGVFDAIENGRYVSPHDAADQIEADGQRIAELEAKLAKYDALHTSINTGAALGEAE